MREHVIWDSDIDLDDCRQDLLDLCEANEWEIPDEDGLWELAYEENSLRLTDERMNLDIQLSHPIIIIGDIGRWDGRKNGYKMIRSGNIKDCLYSEADYNKWYVDKCGNLRCRAAHHDGTNFYLYRELRNLSEEQLDNFTTKILRGELTTRIINHYTRSLGPEIKRVYGW